jgi:peptide/nickel transport system permease protein
MLRFTIKRLLSAIGVLLFLTVVMFLLAKVTPIDPVHAMLGANASPEVVAKERARLGYDRSLPVQYFSYLGGLLHGDLQMSLRTRNPVTKDLASFLPATIELIAFGLLLAVVLGTVLGIAAAGRRRGSGVLRGVLVAGASTPTFLLALVGILIFFSRLGWLPATGRTSLFDAPTGPTGLLTVDGLIHGRFDVVSDALRHLILPGVCVALGPAVAIARVLRSSLISTLRSDHVRTARAKGLRESQVLFRHALRNSSGPALSMGGLQVGLMFSGVIVVETVFAWPGVGLYIVQGIPRADFPAISAVTLVLGVLYVVVNSLVDVLQAAADPRIAGSR